MTPSFARKGVYFAVLGAGVGGLIGALAMPGLFWALLIGGAMTGAALCAAYVLLRSDDGERDV